MYNYYILHITKPSLTHAVQDYILDGLKRLMFLNNSCEIKTLIHYSLYTHLTVNLHLMTTFTPSLINNYICFYQRLFQLQCIPIYLHKMCCGLITLLSLAQTWYI